MKLNLNRQLQTGLRILSLLTVILMPVFLSAQPLFTFGVSNMEAYSRTGNWAWDADNASLPIPGTDANPFTYNAASPHYYSEKYIHIGTTPGHVTSLTCTAENTDLAANAGQLSLVFSQFDLVSFTRINTVNNTHPWDTAGESGDERVYTNASGHLDFNGTPVLYMNNATFVITTPYPSQAQMRLLPGMGVWTGSIGTGLPQTGYGFGDIDTTNPGTDPAWAALFASANYKVDMILTNMVSTKDATTTWLSFNMDISPALLPSTTSSALININTLPAVWDFPDQGTSVSVVSGTPDGTLDEMHHFYIREIKQIPSGVLPAGLGHQAKKYWKFGTTLTPGSFSMDITFKLSGADFNKAPIDWKLLYRPFSNQNWVEWPGGYTLLDATHIKALNVTNVAEFTVASAMDETLPITLTSFTANVSAQSLINVKWTTASETSMLGYKVYYNSSGSQNSIVCLTPSAITAQNSSSGASYSFLANELNEPGTYYFWLEAISIDGVGEFYGPINATLSTTDVPPLPLRNLLSDAWPNPFKIGDNASIRVDLKERENGTVTVYNVAGQMVKTYQVLPGSQTISWDGLDVRGNNCASGIYFYKLSSPSLNQTKKLVLIR